ncbi:glycoside hydrolase family 31 protein [Apiospora arundinis]
MSSSTSSRLLYTALIRTHHITSRKKLQRVKKSALQHELPYVLVRSGGAPGIMYAEAPKESMLAAWVAGVHDLRYKDFQCVRKPALQRIPLGTGSDGKGVPSPSFKELETTAEFGRVMEEKGLGDWWRIGMGYQTEE